MRTYGTKWASQDCFKAFTGLASTLLLCSIIYFVPCQKTALAATMVTAKNSGMVSATPISIPRPIRLEKMKKIAAGSQSNKGTLSSLTPQHDTIEECELVRLQDNELTLRLHYRISPTRSQPIYAGAWLYDANKQAIDAGYKPIALNAFPAGTIDVVLVLPQQDFKAHYVVTFLMESAQPVFVNGRFALPYRWENGVLKATNDIQSLKEGGQGAPALQSKQQFCEAYAKTAVAQFNDAIANNLPGIVPPVWSNNSANHYNWCLEVPKENANQGTALRQEHLDRYKVVGQKDIMQQKNIDTIHQKTVQPIDKAMVVKPVPTKNFDPGRGP